MNNTFQSVCFFTIFIFTFVNASSQDKRLLGIEAEIESLIEKHHAAGLAVSIIENGEILYSAGFGYRDYEKKLPVDANTIFGIGSLTKSFMASVLGIMEDKNQLSLGDRPRKYIPELKFFNSTMDGNIQIKNLLAHNTGISGFSSECSSALFLNEDINMLIPRLQHLKPSANIGERFMYSNYMYTLAGIISERISGKKWHQNITDLIFKPLEMKNSFAYGLDATGHSNFAFGYAVDNMLPARVPVEVVPTRAPAGFIHSSVNDLSKWIITWMNEGKYQDVQIIPLEYLNQAISPQQIVGGGPQERDARQSLFTNYGYGWFSNTYRGYYKVEHSGGVSGYSSNAVFFPTENIGIVVLTNQSMSSLAFQVTELIADRVLELSPNEDPDEPRYSSFVNLTPLSKTIINEEESLGFPLDSLCGVFHHAGYGEVTISLEEEVLFAELPFTKFRLEHVSQNSFISHFTEELSQVMTNSFLRFNFVSDFEGKVSSVRLNVAEEPVEFVRQF